MLNHYPHSQENQVLTLLPEELKGAELYHEVIPLQQGQEVTIQYGDFNSGYLMRWFGFVYADNPYDDCQTLFKDFKESFLTRHGLLHDSHQCMKMKKKKMMMEREIQKQNTPPHKKAGAAKGGKEMRRDPAGQQAPPRRSHRGRRDSHN